MARIEPGKKGRGSRTGRPIMALLDLLGRRWALRILWELRDGPLTFRGLQEQCGGLSPTVLNRRLAELREAAVVELRREAGYVLTGEGEKLLSALSPLSDWARSWGKGNQIRC